MEKEAIRALENETRKLRLLYVEDNTEARISTLLILDEFFDQVETASDGVQGLERFKNAPFDLILSDINMPRMNGIEMIRAIHELQPEVPVLILSAYNEQDFFTESIKAGIDGYMLKPIEISQFLDIMGKIVEKIRLRKENDAYRNQLQQMVAAQTKEIKAKADTIYQQSITDQMTGLYNATILSQILKKGSYDFLMLLDLVSFGIVNKEYGKHFGNSIIQSSAKMLQRHMTSDMRLFKIESDRFAITFKGKNVQRIIEFAEQLIAFFDTTNLMVESNEINVNFTIGISHIDPHDDTLMNAEYALEWAKQMGRRTYHVYERNSNMMVAEQETIKWLNRTRYLISEDKIEPYFQPIMDIKSGKVIKYEVLARGIDGDEVIAPCFFLGAAERLGLMTAITRGIINKSFTFFAANAFDFGINLSEHDLIDDNFCSYLFERARYYGIDPSRVTLEILEGVTMSYNADRIAEVLNCLRGNGFVLAVDDFGIDNSNFSRLLDIELDLIKIDGAFVRNIVTSKKDAKIVTAIVNLAHTLGIKTVAEFVENEEILEVICACGVDFAQGYHIGKPESKLLEHHS